MNSDNTVWLPDSLQRSEWKDFTPSFVDILEHAEVNVNWLVGTKDIWARDYMPVEYAPNEFVQFRYAPTYLTKYPSYKDKLTNGAPILNNYLRNAEIWENQLKVDGGNVIMNDDVAILTDRVYSENPELEPQFIADLLADQLQRNILIIPADKDDEIGHADGLVRFALGNRVLVNEYTQDELEFFATQKSILENAGFETWCLPYNPYKNNTLLDATGIYINFLQIGKKIFVPEYGGHLKDEDGRACLSLMEMFETDEVYQVPCQILAKKGGVLNCISWTRL